MLRGCKFSLEKAKRKIEAWNTIRTMCPEIYDNWDVDTPQNRDMINLGYKISCHWKVWYLQQSFF